jgi:hypothetical protein
VHKIPLQDVGAIEKLKRKSGGGFGELVVICKVLERL